MATEFKPNYAIHPGVFLREEMEAMNMTQKELAEKIGCSPSIVNEVLHEKRKINADIAVRLEEALYSPASYWLRLQAIYSCKQAIFSQSTGTTKNVRRFGASFLYPSVCSGATGEADKVYTLPMSFVTVRVSTTMHSAIFVTSTSAMS